MISYNDDWITPQQTLTKKQKREAAKLRAEFYVKLRSLRADIIEFHLQDHIHHCFAQIITKYIDDTFDGEDILCSCGDTLIISKQRMEKANDGPLKIIHPSKVV